MAGKKKESIESAYLNLLFSPLAFHIKLSETSEKGVRKWEDLICGTFFGEIKLAFLTSPFKGAGWEFPGGAEVTTHSFHC